jgi:hypothetical protein
MMANVNAVLSHGQLWMVKLGMVMMLFDPSLSVE